jgi:acyl-CoA synthetase (AMP-forming)/AMP-acid ligase II
MDTVLLQLGQAGSPPGDAARDAAAFAAPDLASPANLAIAFREVARARAQHPALATRDGAYTYDWVLRAADCVRQHLSSRAGHRPGARVALQLANSPEYLAAFYGTLLADGVVVPLPGSLERLRRDRIYDLCRPDVVISRHEDYEGDDSADVLQLPQAEGKAKPGSLPLRGGDDLAMLLFTSGSTGMPKGVMLSHRNLLANAKAILQDLPIRPDDRTLVVLPFCHAFGNSILQTHMLTGATLMLDRGMAFPSSIVGALAERKATSFSAIPEVYGMLLKYGGLGDAPLPHLRYMTVAGGEMRHALAATIAEWIAPATFHVMYGQSEATARLASLPAAELLLRPGSIGKPVPGVALAVMDDAGRQLPSDTVGMLCARGDSVMLGYLDDPAATDDAVQDGWLRTGDLAHCDADGYFYLHGRANLLVKVQGHRVHPLEIEHVVEAGFPDARAVALPMAQGGETRFALFLAPQGNQPIDLAQVRAACVRELPSYKVPVHFEVLDELPLTSAHKVDRTALSLRVPASRAVNENE